MPDLYYRLMHSADEDDTAEKCRERRRRRILMRSRSQATNAGTVPPPASAHPKGKGVEEAPQSNDGVQDQMALQIAQAPPVNVPSFGTMTVAGRSRDMEDAIAAYTSLCSPAINGQMPVHFFGVYDGHGGSQVAALCRERMHVLLQGELSNGDHTINLSGAAGSSSSAQGLPTEAEEEWKEKWKAVLKRSFMRMDQEALNTCVCGSIGLECDCPSKVLIIGGSTAVVAVLTTAHIIVANCGDSRAVLCRGGRAIPLSCDQKPDRSDEYERIIAAGGRVVNLDGARVEGILAMSRAIGDRYLKPIVISEPEIRFMKRDPEDECLILASDGLWDVLPNELACSVASECLFEENPTDFINAGPHMENDVGGALFSSQSVLAAALLTRLALARRSCDNISVIVIDLMRG